MENNFTNLNNEEIINLIRRGEKSLVDELFIRNQNGIRKAAYNFYSKHYKTISQFGCYEFEDLLQMANMSFMESIESYNPDKEAKYITYLMNLIFWQLNMFFFRHGKIKHDLRAEYNTAAILEDTLDLDFDNQNEEFNIEKGTSYHVPIHEEKFDDRMVVEEILNKLKKERDREIIEDYYLRGFSYEDIRLKYELKSERIANRTVSRIIGKIRKQEGV